MIITHDNHGLTVGYMFPSSFAADFLMGLGIPFTYMTIKTGTAYSVSATAERRHTIYSLSRLQIDKSLLQNVIAYFLFGSLASTLIFIPLNKFYYSRRFGLLLILYYVIFLVIAILIETNVIG